MTDHSRGTMSQRRLKKKQKKAEHKAARQANLDKALI
jgi:hypothetical protein